MNMIEILNLLESYPIPSSEKKLPLQHNGLHTFMFKRDIFNRHILPHNLQWEMAQEIFHVGIRIQVDAYNSLMMLFTSNHDTSVYLNGSRFTFTNYPAKSNFIKYVNPVMYGSDIVWNTYFQQDSKFSNFPHNFRKHDIHSVINEVDITMKDISNNFAPRDLLFGSSQNTQNLYYNNYYNANKRGILTPSFQIAPSNFLEHQGLVYEPLFELKPHFSYITDQNGKQRLYISSTLEKIDLKKNETQVKQIINAIKNMSHSNIFSEFKKINKL